MANHAGAGPVEGTTLLPCLPFRGAFVELGAEPELALWRWVAGRYSATIAISRQDIAVVGYRVAESIPVELWYYGGTTAVFLYFFWSQKHGGTRRAIEDQAW